MSLARVRARKKKSSRGRSCVRQTLGGDSVRRQYAIAYDHAEVKRILERKPEERAVKLPKTARSESATPWQIKRVPKVSPAEQKAREERRSFCPLQ